MKITPRDWALLSAYIDGELSSRKQKILEDRLEQKPELRAALDDLRKTKNILASVPRLSVPKDFTLTPDMVGLVRRRSPAGGYRLAAAVLSFLFIAVVLVDFSGLVSHGGLQAGLAPRSEEVMLEAMPLEAADSEAIESLEEPETLAAEEALESEAAAGDEEEAPQEPDTPLAEQELTADSPAAEESEGAAATEIPPEATTKTAPDQADLDEENLAEEEREGDQSVEEFQDQPAEPEEQLYLPPDDSVRQIPQITPGIVLRFLEVLLGLGALILAAAAWKKGRK